MVSREVVLGHKSLSLPCFRSIRSENSVALTGVASSTLPFPGVVTKACIS